MDHYKLVIRGEHALSGETFVSGGKNTSVAVIPAALLCSDVCVIENLPDIEDVRVLKRILAHLGAKVEFDAEHNRMTIDPRGVTTCSVPFQYSQQMRASYYLMGALLGRCGEAEVGYPGGCDIGSRPIDQHIKGFSMLGAQIDEYSGMMNLKGELRGSIINFDVVTVGGTINVMLAAVKAKGNTILMNAAREPHVVDAANFLNAMGARIRGAGTNVIKIDGVGKLRGRDYTIIPDRIEAGTYMVAAAMTRGDVYIENAITEHLKPVIAKLKEAGVTIDEDVNGIRVRCDSRTKAVDIKTMPYPGFPTDMQAQFMAMLAVSEGTGLVTETVFENRFMHVDELKRMGANIKIEGRTSVVEGVGQLTGCQVKATDLRAGAAMVLAGLIADGETQIGYIHHIDRGYDHLVDKLVGLGADICRVDK